MCRIIASINAGDDYSVLIFIVQLLVDSTPFLPHQSSTSGISPSSPTSDARHQLPGDVISPSLSGEVDQQAGTQAMYGSTAAASSLLAYPAARVAALTAATDYTSYTAAAAATGQTYVPFDSSAFYSPLVRNITNSWQIDWLKIQWWNAVDSTDLIGIERAMGWVSTDSATACWRNADWYNTKRRNRVSLSPGNELMDCW